VSFEYSCTHPLLVSFGSFYYEGSKLNQSDLPNTYLDLLDPRWKGKLILTYPNDDDAITYLFSIITSKYGFNWLEGLAQQDVQWVRGTATPAILLGNSSKNSSSQRVLSFTTLGHYTNGPTIKLQAPSLEEYMSWYQRIGIFGSTRCPESSKLFVSWLLSDEYQQTISNSSNTVLNHLNQQSGFNIYASNTTQVGGFPRFMTDRATVEWWRTQFELTLGTAIGPDPNVLY